MADLNDPPEVQSTNTPPIIVELSEFPTEGSAESAASNQTSSDKLTALPSTSSPPPLSRNRTPTQLTRRLSNSLPSLFSSSPPHGSTDLPLPTTGQKPSASDGSVEKDTSNHKVSFDSDKISLQNVRQSMLELLWFFQFILIHPSASPT